MRLNSPQINIITKACLKASRSLIRDFGEIENLQVSSKGPGDFVSSADKRTEKLIIDELQKAHPEYGIVIETKIKDYGAYREQDAMTREWVRVLWVGNKPVSSWHVIYSRNPRLIKLGGIGFND